MRLTVFILMVTVSCCMGHRGKHRDRSYSRSKSYRPIFNLPLFPRPPIKTTKAPPTSRPISAADDFLAAEIGVRLPPKECVISYDEFVEFTLNKVIVVNSQNVTIGYFYNDTFHVAVSRPQLDHLNSTCGFVDTPFRRVDETKAIFRAIGATGSEPFLTSTRIDYFLSFNPRKYLIQYACYDDVFRGRCRNSEIALHVKEQRPGPPNSDGIIQGDICLDDVPWGLVETTYRNCLGMQFMDRTEPQLEWFWTDDDDCPKPETDAFRRQVAKRK